MNAPLDLDADYHYIKPRIIFIFLFIRVLYFSVSMRVQYRTNTGLREFKCHHTYYTL